MSDDAIETPVVEVTGHAYGTSSLKNMLEKIRTITATTGSYNPDLEPCQNPALRQDSVDITDPAFREALWHNSVFLQKQTTELVREIFDQGWIATNGQALPEFAADQREKFIECFSSSMVIDSCYVFKFETKQKTKWIVLSSNYIWRRLCNVFREITEVYFEFPVQPDLYSEIDQANFATEIVGFLTQHATDKVRPHRFLQTLNPNVSVSQAVISRNCVQCMPSPHPEYADGIPLLLTEAQTALEKLYLRFYELMFIHKGGINKTMVIPDGLPADVKKTAAKEYKRGMLSLGGIISIKGVEVPQTFLVTETPIPDLRLDIINSHLSEDAKVSKQKIEGEAASGALGGQAPKVNQQEDDKTIQRLKPALAQFLKDIYDVFYGIDPKPYEIEFKEMEDEVVNTETDARQDTEQAHSVDDDYVTYTANMFPSGIYDYPEKGSSDFYSREDIETLTKRSVNKFYLEVDHSYKPELVDITEGVGYGEIIGFDPVKGADITKLHIKRPIADQLGKTIKLSPYFNKISLANKKLLSIRNCAIMKNQSPRSELTGLRAEGTRDE